MKNTKFLLSVAGLAFLAGFGVYAANSGAFNQNLEFRPSIRPDDSITKWNARRPVTASLVNIESWIFHSAKSAERESLIEDHILYETVFRFDLSFRRKALEQELMGQPVTSFKSYFKDEIGLTDEENEILRQTGLEYLEEMHPIDAQAIQVLADFREQFPDGYVETGQEVPPPPPALAGLQEQRNATALNGRDKLASRFSSKTFQNFDEFVKTKFAENFQSLSPARGQ